MATNRRRALRREDPDLFQLCPSSHFLHLPVTEHLSLHSKSKCAKMVRANEGGGGGSIKLHHQNEITKRKRSLLLREVKGTKVLRSFPLQPHKIIARIMFFLL